MGGREGIPIHDRNNSSIESEISQIMDGSIIRPWDRGVHIPVGIQSKEGEPRNFGEMLDTIGNSPVDESQLTGVERTTTVENKNIPIEAAVQELWATYGFPLVADAERKMIQLVALEEKEHTAIDAYRKGLVGLGEGQAPSAEKQASEEAALLVLSADQRFRLASIRTLLSNLEVLTPLGTVDSASSEKSPMATYYKWMGLLYRRSLYGGLSDPLAKLMSSEAMAVKELRREDPSFPETRARKASPEVFRLMEEELEKEYRRERLLEWELEVVMHDLLETGSDFNLTGVLGEPLSGYLYETAFKGEHVSKALEVLSRKWPEQMQALDANGYVMFMPPELDGRVRIIVQKDGVKFQLDGQFFGFLSHSEGLQKSLPQLKPMAL